MDITRALTRYLLLVAASRGLTGKANATRAFFYHTVLRLGLWQKPRLFEIEVDNIRFTIDLGRKELASILEVVLEKSYEPNNDWIPRRGQTVVDVGANVGAFAIVQGGRVDGGRVYAFELSPTSYVRLKRNVAINNLQNIHTFSYALGNRSGSVKFVDKAISLNSCVAEGTSEEPTIDVSVKTLDEFVHANAIPEIDLMKIDTEGYELPVLLGGLSALRVTRRIVLETHPGGDDGAVIELLDSRRFRMAHQAHDLSFFERY